MPTTSQTSFSGKIWLAKRLIIERPVRTSLVASFLLFATIATYGVLKGPEWEATQPLVIRAEALEGSKIPGRFESDQQRRHVLDTLVAVFQSQDVLEATLREVGPARPVRRHSFPDRRDIERLRRSVQIVPPSDTDFGTTELVYLKVRDARPERAGRLASVLVEQADRRLREVQAAKAEATVQELVFTEKSANDVLQNLKEELAALEAQLGLDSLTLRAYEEKPDESLLRSAIEELDDQLDELEAQIVLQEELLRLLRGTLATPEALASIPPAMLEKYPTLKRFQEALTDAEVKLIELRGQYADEHPAVIAAQLALQDLTNRISEEVPTVIQTIENEQAVAANQKQFLEQKRQTEEARVQHILAVLPKYRQLMAAIRAQSETVRDAQHRLAIARAGAASARSARLITAVEPPRTGNRPVGPGTLTIVAGGFVCGLFLALCVFLWLTPVAPSETKPIVTSHAPTHEEDGDQPVQAEMVLPTAKKETRIPSEADVTSHGPLFDSPGAEAQPALASTAIQPTTPDGLWNDPPSQADTPTNWPAIPVAEDWAESPLHQALAGMAQSRDPGGKA